MNEIPKAINRLSGEPDGRWDIYPGEEAKEADINAEIAYSSEIPSNPDSQSNIIAIDKIDYYEKI